MDPQIQPNIPEQPREIPNANHKHLWPIVLGAVVLFLTVTLGLIFWLKISEKNVSSEQQTSETGTWQTYRNDEYGFEFKYPELDKQHPAKIDSSKTAEYMTELPSIRLKYWNNKYNEYTGDFYVFIMKNDSKLTLKEWFAKEIDLENMLTIGGVFELSTLPDGGEVMKKDPNKYIPDKYLDEAGPVLGEYFAMSPDKAFVFNLSEGQDRTIGTNLITQILSTFKFIDPTANWRTYRNDEYGFEIRYPDELFRLEEHDVGIQIHEIGLDVGGTEGAPSGIFVYLENTKYNNIDEFFNNYKNSYLIDVSLKREALMTDIQKINFIGIPAYSYIDTFGASASNVILFLRLGISIEVIKSTLGSKLEDEIIHDKILNTFKFTNQ